MHGWGLRLRRVRARLAIAPAAAWPSVTWYDVGTPDAIISQLITLPTCAPVNASMAASRLATHDSGSGRVATPFLCDALIHDSTPVYPGAHHGLLHHPELERFRDRVRADLIATVEIGDRASHLPHPV